MEYAVIRTGGKQYRVSPGDIIRVEKLPGDVGGAVVFGEVLLAGDDGNVQVGQPTVSGLEVQGEIVAHGKAKKILVFKKKRRKNYRRRQGHRQPVTTVKVTAIAAAATATGHEHGA